MFDLRGNPGGFITTAQGIASQFVPAGELLFTVESGEDVQRWESEPGGLAQTDAIPVVVLVDGGSASASEIVAGALKETGRATIVGEPTFGKNTVQIWNDLPNGGGLRITTDRWFTPLHNSAAPDGIQPDVVVASPEIRPAATIRSCDRAVELLRRLTADAGPRIAGCQEQLGIEVSAGDDHHPGVVSRHARGVTAQVRRHGGRAGWFDHQPRPDERAGASHRRARPR